MELSRNERLILFNQFTILSMLDSSNDGWKRSAKIVACGYELEYSVISQHIYEDHDTLSSAQCIEVIDILDMYNSLQRGHQALPSSTTISKGSVLFRGFDGNHETTYLAYTRFIVEDSERFTDVDHAPGFNSHMPILDKYRRMLKEWEESYDKHILSESDITRITSA